MARLDRPARLRKWRKSAPRRAGILPALLAAAAGQSGAESALDRLIEAGLLFRRGTAQATFLFKHALVQDAAYGTLLREPRRRAPRPHREAFETQFAEVVASNRSCWLVIATSSRADRKGSSLWGKAGEAFTGALGAGGSRGPPQTRAGADRGFRDTRLCVASRSSFRSR